MKEGTIESLREQVKGYTCNQFSIANHDGDAVALLRKLADSIEQLGPVNILDITYGRFPDCSSNEITVSVYFSLR